MKDLVIPSIVAVGIVLAWTLIDRIIAPARARKTIKRLMQDSQALNRHGLENPRYGVVTSDGQRLRVASPRGDIAELLWSEVEEVYAYKQDLGTTDLICIAFKRAGIDEFYEIHEEMQGYHELLAGLPTSLPGFSDNWFSSVAFPAFVPNHQVIWTRAEPSADGNRPSAVQSPDMR